VRHNVLTSGILKDALQFDEWFRTELIVMVCIHHIPV